MGSGMKISCNGCNLELDAMLGMGFAGVQKFACACDTCKKITVVSGPSMFDHEPEPVSFTCKKCSNPMRVLGEDQDDVDDDGEILDHPSLGKCPRCGGELHSRFNGVLWD
jgi:Zn finger protein HypA/HybF involved in hydrogenase expression